MKNTLKTASDKSRQECLAAGIFDTLCETKAKAEFFTLWFLVLDVRKCPTESDDGLMHCLFKGEAAETLLVSVFFSPTFLYSFAEQPIVHEWC